MKNFLIIFSFTVLLVSGCTTLNRGKSISDPLLPISPIASSYIIDIDYDFYGIIENDVVFDETGLASEESIQRSFKVREEAAKDLIRRVGLENDPGVRVFKSTGQIAIVVTPEKLETIKATPGVARVHEDQMLELQLP